MLEDWEKEILKTITLAVVGATILAAIVTTLIIAS